MGRPGPNNHRNRDVGFLAGLRTMLFGARDPESDLSIEMLEELHMVTGCKKRSTVSFPFSKAVEKQRRREQCAR